MWIWCVYSCEYDYSLNIHFIENNKMPLRVNGSTSRIEETEFYDTVRWRSLIYTVRKTSRVVWQIGN